MHTLNRWVVVSAVVLGIAGWGIADAPPLSAQCSMSHGSGGGHDHGAGQEDATKRQAAARKQMKSVDHLLADEQGRQMLADALFQDPEFMRAFIARAMAVPEWRALASKSPAAPSMAPTGSSKSEPAMVYTCPMHPEVTSATTGSCPKCGMKLVVRTATGT